MKTFVKEINWVQQIPFPIPKSKKGPKKKKNINKRILK